MVGNKALRKEYKLNCGNAQVYGWVSYTNAKAEFSFRLLIPALSLFFPRLPLGFLSVTVKGHNGPEKINPSKEGFGPFHL